MYSNVPESAVDHPKRSPPNSCRPSPVNSIGVLPPGCKIARTSISATSGGRRKKSSTTTSAIALGSGVPALGAPINRCRVCNTAEPSAATNARPETSCARLAEMKVNTVVSWPYKPNCPSKSIVQSFWEVDCADSFKWSAEPRSPPSCRLRDPLCVRVIVSKPLEIVAVPLAGNQWAIVLVGAVRQREVGFSVPSARRSTAPNSESSQAPFPCGSRSRATTSARIGG